MGRQAISEPPGSIEHIVVLMLENRSFDHMLGFLDRPGLEPLEQGSYPNPLRLESPGGQGCGVNDAGSYALPVDPPHSHHSVMTQLDCGSDLHCGSEPRMDGFVASYLEKTSGHEHVAVVRWWLLAVVLELVAAGACAAAYGFGNRWLWAGIMAGVAGLVPTAVLFSLRHIMERWWVLVVALSGGAIALGLLARSMRHDWWAAGLVFIVLSGVVAAGLLWAARRPRYVHPKDLAHAYEDAPMVMRCMKSGEIPALATLARSFAVCTRWHASAPGATWPNRNFAHAGTSAGTTDIEFGFYRNRTIFEVLFDEGKTWHVYHHGMAQVMAFPKLWRKSWENWFDMEDFEQHIRDRTLPNYSFIEPAHEGPESNSQHPGNNFVPAIGGVYDFQRGEALIARVYEALRATPGVFEKTLLLITYDEHGGLFDHCPPPTDAVPPRRSHMSPSRWMVNWFVHWGSEGFDFKTLGVRVPAVVVSPRVPSMVDPTPYDHSSIVATVRAVFAPSSRPLSDRAAHANTFDHLARVPPRSDLPDLGPHLTPGPWNPRAIQAGEVGAAVPVPVSHTLTSQFDRLDRGVRWRARVRHPVSWSRTPSGRRSRRREFWLGRRVRREGVTAPEAPVPAGPHADTVERFMHQSERARRRGDGGGA